MAIRIRKIDGSIVALCAAKTEPKVGDIYLDDNVHHALSTKFGVDWVSEERLTIENEGSDDVIKKLMLKEESNG